MENIKQHYVPQFYLKNFSKDEKSIYCYDKVKRKSYSQNIKNIAQGKYFYGKDLILEKNLGYLERWGSKYINKLIETHDLNFFSNIETKKVFADFITYQFFRTEEIRKTFEEYKTKNPNFLKNENSINDYFNDMLKTSFLFDISDKIIFRKKWVLLINKTKLEFCTSDNPVVFFSSSDNYALNAEYVQIYFPISTNLCICLLDPYHFYNFNVPKEFNEKQVFNNINKPSKYILEEQLDVEMINYLEADQSTRHIFSKTNNFKWVNKLFKDGVLVNPKDKTRFKKVYY